MQWQDEGLVIGTRRQGESGVVLELMTRRHGRHAGWVHGGRSRRLQPVLQPGNSVEVVWRARLDEQLGHYGVEAKLTRASGYLGSPLALFGIGTLAGHLRLLPERDPHPELFEAACLLADHLGDGAVAPSLFVRFEIMLLAELGFGLDLARCAATGAPDDLAYVSPKTGRAVGRVAGEPYRTRLLALPAFLQDDAASATPDAAALAAAFVLTGHFLERHVYEPRGQGAPEERRRFIARIAGAGSASGMLRAEEMAATDSPPDRSP